MPLVAELLYHGELEHKALLMPEQDLKHRIAEFEQSVSPLFEAGNAKTCRTISPSTGSGF